VPEPDDFMTVAEIAAILKLNQKTVRNWIDSGKLPALHVGRRVCIRRADFDALIAQNAIGHREPEPAPASVWNGEIPLPEVPVE
jgi:excisionase family DNA binding protein